MAAIGRTSGRAGPVRRSLVQEFEAASLTLACLTRSGDGTGTVLDVRCLAETAPSSALAEARSAAELDLGQPTCRSATAALGLRTAPIQSRAGLSVVAEIRSTCRSVVPSWPGVDRTGRAQAHGGRETSPVRRTSPSPGRRPRNPIRGAGPVVDRSGELIVRRACIVVSATSPRAWASDDRYMAMVIEQMRSSSTFAHGVAGSRHPARLRPAGSLLVEVAGDPGHGAAIGVMTGMRRIPLGERLDRAAGRDTVGAAGSGSRVHQMPARSGRRRQRVASLLEPLLLLEPAGAS